MLLDHADFALQEQAEDNLMVVFFLEHGKMAHTMANQIPRIALYNDPVFNNKNYHSGYT